MPVLFYLKKIIKKKKLLKTDYINVVNVISGYIIGYKLRKKKADRKV